MSDTAKMTRSEMLAALLWLPVHILLLPELLRLWRVGAAARELVRYALGAVWMLGMLRRFFRRECRDLRGKAGGCLSMAVGSFFALLAANFLMGRLVWLLGGGQNPNNQAVAALGRGEFLFTAAAAVLFAPVVEETVFRAAIFEALRGRDRRWAYAVSTGLFALYHVWPYLLRDLSGWVYLLEYLPAGLLLAHCYDRAENIAAPLMLHGLTNALSMAAIWAGGGLLL